MLGVAAVVLVAAAAVLLAPPRYALTMPRQGQIVAAPGSRLKVEVKNAGLLSGTLRSAFTLDGVSQGPLQVAVSARGATTVDLPLPGSLSPGKHVATVAGQTLAFTALSPADFDVSPLVIAPSAALVHAPVVVVAEVTNRGEASGVFAGELEVDGHAAQTKPVSLAGGASKSVSYQFTRATPGRYVVRLGDSPRSAIDIVKPFRPATGAVLARSSSGPGRLTFQNQMHEDCMVVLSTDAAGGRRPSLAFYVRSKSSATVTGIGDGKLYIYFTSGTDWNRTMRDFLTTDDRERFKHAAAFTTSSWTSSYTDWSAWTVYTTHHTEYTGWTIKVSDEWVWGPTGGTVEVSSSRFPKV